MVGHTVYSIIQYGILKTYIKFMDKITQVFINSSPLVRLSSELVPEIFWTVALYHEGIPSVCSA
jgi:hypothetical protein